MKQGTLINKIVMVIFFLAILLYLGGAAWKGLRDPYPAVQAYSYQMDDTIEATGYLVRSEEVLTGTGGIVRLTPAEGEKVAAGATVALLYADEDALERDQRLETLRAEEAQLAAAITAAGEDSTQGEKSSKVVLDNLVKLRAAVEKGDFTRLESQTTAFKSAVYQQAQRYGDADSLSAALSSTRAEIDALMGRMEESVGRVSVSRSGIFSGQVDGYEEVLTPDVLDTIMPSDLDAMESRARPVGRAQLGKLITSSKWYFVCPLTVEESTRLIEGKKATVRFSRDWAGEVTMTVERLGKAQDGRVTAVLSSNKFLSDTTLLRRQTVELVFERRTGIRVPTRAIRVESEKRTDKETGEETTVQVTCVYVRVGVKAERKPVAVLAQEEEYTLVAAQLGEDPTAAQQKKALRAGDLVITASGEIWDGKVLE